MGAVAGVRWSDKGNDEIDPTPASSDDLDEELKLSKLEVTFSLGEMASSRGC